MKRKKWCDNGLPHTLYHVTLPGLLPAIFELGLLPNLATGCKRVWMCEGRQIAKVCRHLRPLKNDWPTDQGFLVVRVDVRGFPVLFNGRYWFSTHPVEPRRLVLHGRYGFDIDKYERLPRTVRGYGPHLDS